MSGIDRKKGGDGTGKLYKDLMTPKTWENRRNITWIMVLKWFCYLN